MRSYALLLASAASAYPVAPRRALRINALRAAPEVSEQQSWMIDYMAKAHTARLEAVQRAKAEAAAAKAAVRGLRLVYGFKIKVVPHADMTAVMTVKARSRAPVFV